MDPLTTLAIVKAIKEKDEKEARAAVSAGVHPIDRTVHISGMLTVGVDTPAGPGATVESAAKFDPWLLLAVALESDEYNSLGKLCKVAAKYKDTVVARSIEAQAQELAAKLLPKVTITVGGSSARRGSVSFNGIVEVK